MTGIFFAQVAAKTATNIMLYYMPIQGWPVAVARALLTTNHDDAFYMPAAIALMQHYQS